MTLVMAVTYLIINQCVTSRFSAEGSEIIQRIFLREKRWLVQSRGRSRDSLNGLSVFSFMSVFFFICLFGFIFRPVPLSLVEVQPVVIDNVNFVQFQRSNIVITKKISYTGLACVCVSTCVYTVYVCEIEIQNVVCNGLLQVSLSSKHENVGKVILFRPLCVCMLYSLQ